MTELLDHFRQREDDEAFERLLAQRRLTNPFDPDFALTTRSRQLRVRGTEEEVDPKARPFVLALAIPRQHRDPLWAASDNKLFAWLQDPAAKYAPLGYGRAVAGKAKPMHGGIIMSESDGRSGKHYRRYTAVERTGIVEMGLGAAACMIHDHQVGFLLTRAVAAIWHMLGFVDDLYRHLGISQPFTLVVALRETRGAILAGLAERWQEPWTGFSDYRPECREPSVMLTHWGIGPVLNGDAARSLARELAYEIEAAWGHGGPGHIARCFKPAEGGGEGEFDLNAASR